MDGVYRLVSKNNGLMHHVVLAIAACSGVSKVADLRDEIGSRTCTYALPAVDITGLEQLDTVTLRCCMFSVCLPDV